MHIWVCHILTIYIRTNISITILHKIESMYLFNWKQDKSSYFPTKENMIEMMFC